MGLPISDAAMLVEVTRNQPNKDTAICLGEPYLGFTLGQLKRFCTKINVKWNFKTDIDPKKTLTGKDLFTLLGFKEYISMDISDYEGAEIIHNLNDNNLKPEYYNRADIIYDGGTLEHVFNLPNALECVFKLLKPEGVICHHNPSNGYLDHGFYQICPTFYYDYYKANGYSIVSANLISRLKGTYSEAYTGDIYRRKGMLHGIEKLPRTTLFFCARKKINSTFNQVPIQSYYNEMHTDFTQNYENEFPFNFKLIGIKDVLLYRFPKTIKTVKSILGLSKS